MKSKRSGWRGVPEAAGYGFVLGVLAGTLAGSSVLCVSASALGGALALPALRRHLPSRVSASVWIGKIRSAIRPADIQSS